VTVLIDPPPVLMIRLAPFRMLWITDVIPYSPAVFALGLIALFLAVAPPSAFGRRK
jgi:hypothetical protein